MKKTDGQSGDGLGTAFHCLAGATVAILLLSPLGALQPFEWGAWRLTSVSILMMYLGAASAAMTLALYWLQVRSLSDPAIPRPAVAVASGGLLLAAAGLPGALFADFPSLAIVGTFQSGLGILWFLHFALAVLLFGILDRVGSWRRILDLAILIALAGLTIARVVDMLTPQSVLLLPGGDSYAYPAAAGIAFALARQGQTDTTGKAIFGVSAILMAVSGNVTAIVLSAAGAAAMALARIRPATLTAMQALARPVPALILLLGTILCPIVLLIILPLDSLPASLQSRVHIHEMSAAVLQGGDFLEWLFGRGWGHTQSAYYANLLAAEYPIYRQEWDFLWRDIFHSHNAAVEILLAGGLVGLAVHCAVFWLAIRLTARIGHSALWFLLLFYLAMAGVWFEYSFALPFLALAAVRCTCQQTGVADGAVAPPWRRSVVIPSLVVAAFLFGFAFVRLAPFEVAVAEHKFDTLIEIPDQPLRLDTFPTDPRGSRFVESIVLREMWHKRALLRESRGWPDDSNLATGLLDRVETVLPEVSAAPMLLVGLSVLNDVAYYQGAEMQQIALREAGLWQRLVHRHWALVPERSDVAVGYFEFLKRAGAYDVLAAECERRMQVRPKDPVAIYYAALASLHRIPAEQNPEAMRSILRAIDLGLDVMLPIDPQFEDDLRREFGDPDDNVGSSATQQGG